MDRVIEAIERLPIEATDADADARPSAAAVALVDHGRRRADAAVPDWASAQELTFTANGLAG
jgi:hypothetical protein